MQALLSPLQQIKCVFQTPHLALAAMYTLHTCIRIPQGMQLSSLLIDVGQQKWGLFFMTAISGEKARLWSMPAYWAGCCLQAHEHVAG